MKQLNYLLIGGLSIMLVLTSFTLLEEPPGTNPIKLTVLYGHPDDPAAFETYYLNIHGPIAARIRGVSKMELTKFEQGSLGEEPAYYRMAELYFPTKEAMEKSLDSPEGKAVLEDLSNFATGGTIAIVGTAGDFEFLAD